MRLFIALILVSFNALAVEWPDLEEGVTYKLTQSFQLPQSERSGSFLDFMKGEEVQLKEIAPLSHIGVMLYVFDYKNCPGPEMKANMEIIGVQNTYPVVEIGAELEINCELYVFIETRDLYSKSIFE